MAYIINENTLANGLEIAVIGMSGRFPGATDMAAFRDLLVNNKTTVSFFKESEIYDPMVPSSVTKDVAYVKARGILKDISSFDADLFGYTPHEARLLDPQVRFFHECAWETLEDAGYIPSEFEGKIGVFAGAHKNAFWELNAMLAHNDADYGNKDFLATRLCYKLNLRGPGETIYTACSTSLVTVHMACRSLLNGECDMALAGGVSVELPQNRGYQYTEGNILSSSGYNRSFDAGADGTVFSNGAGVVLLKLLEDAIKDGDNIHAVIKGSAVNNDGNWKVSFTGPGVKGQVDVIKSALQFSGVSPEEICYVEAHGSATLVGDPIEVEALKQAFGQGKEHYCGIGSVKSNIGHTNAAAGIAGLLKGILTVKHKMIPATVNYTSPNAGLKLEHSPFYVADRNISLANMKTPVRIGVTSLGVGGTNAHMILEEPPVWQAAPTGRKYQLLTGSAKTKDSLSEWTTSVNGFLETPHGYDPADIGWSLNTGRTPFPVRVAGVMSSPVKTDWCEITENKNVSIITVFPGEHGYVPGMGTGIYEHETGFRLLLDSVFDSCSASTGLPLLSLFLEQRCSSEQEHIVLAFCVQYALGCYLRELGLLTGSLTGYAAGKKVVDCLEGKAEPGATAASLHVTDDDVQIQLENTAALVMLAGHCPALVNHTLIPVFPPIGEAYTEAFYFTRQLGILWTYGNKINWQRYYRHEERRKVSLPAYAFSKKAYWIDEIDMPALQEHLSQSGEERQLLYRPVWKHKQPQLLQHKITSCLIFGWEDALSAALQKQVEDAGGVAICVYPGSAFKKDARNFTINPAHSGDYALLVRQLHEMGFIPQTILHCWNVASFADFETSQQYGYYSLIYLAGAVSAMNVQITVVTSGLQDVAYNDVPEMSKATLLGPLHVLPLENIQLIIRNVDFDGHTLQQTASAAERIMNEALCETGDKIIAYRGRRRYTEDYERYTADSGNTNSLKDQAVYVIPGGLGNIGIHIASYISQQVKAVIILTSRSRSDEHLSSAQQELLHGIEMNGSSLILRKADVASRNDMHALWQEIYDKYKRLDGVIYTAGVLNGPSANTPAELINTQLTDEQFAAKVKGVNILKELFDAYPAPSFCVLNSSLSAIMGGIGFTAYSAANVYMDYFCRAQQNSANTRWITINWDSWQFDNDDNKITYVIRPKQALEAFAGILNAPDAGQVIVAAGNLAKRLAKLKQLEQHATHAGPLPVSIAEGDHEQLVIALLKKHLGHENIELNDDFFSLGGDSFTLLAFTNELKKLSGRNINIKECYENPDVKGLINLVKSKEYADSKVIKPATKKEHYPLSAAQSRMYYHYAMDTESTAYNETKVFEVSDAIDLLKLNNAFSMLIDRHESLRTSFTSAGEETVQVIHDTCDFQIDVYDACNMEINEFITTYIRAFKLEEAPLMRVALVKPPDGKTYLVADLHHIICDALSLDIIKKEVLTLYAGQVLPKVQLQYKDVSEYWNSPTFLARQQSQQSWWMEVLQGAGTPVAVPVDYYTREADIVEDASMVIRLHETETAAISNIIREEGVSLFAFLAGAFSALLARYTGVTDLTIGVPVSGRTEAAFEQIVGMFVNILPLRSMPLPGKSFVDFVREVNKTGGNILQHQDYPYNDLVRDLKYKYGIEHPLFNVVFNFMNNHRQETVSENVFGKEVSFTANRISKYKFIINVTESEEGISVVIDYSPQQYSEHTIFRLLEHLIALIFAIYENRSLLINEIPLKDMYEPASGEEEDGDFFFG